MIPVIAIVGKPNVGKSTLFNCLTQSRSALVSSVPGMTRDRQYGEAIFNNKRFIVIDTGGITPDKDEINKHTTTQAIQATRDADSILFVVDGRDGLTSEDRDISQQLFSLNKPIFIVINKAEGIDDDLAFADFYSLGLGTLHAISASHRSGITELMESVFLNSPTPNVMETEIPSTDNGIKLAIIGRPNVGKSTLTNRMLGEERVIVCDQPGTTRDSIFIPLERFNTKYILIDTAGIRRRGKIFEAPEKFSVVKTLQSIEACNVVLFMMDAHEGVTDQDLRLLGFVLETGKALVLAMNKWDGMDTDTRERTKALVDRRLDFLSFVRIHTISALHGTGVGNLFSSIQEAYHSATQKLSTAQLTKILLEAIKTHTPPLVHGRRIKLRYAHAGGHNPPLIILHGNQVNSLPDSYRRYLANTFQARLNLMGTPVHIEVKNSENPFRHKKNILSQRQQRKKTRMIRHRKKDKS